MYYTQQTWNQDSKLWYVVVNLLCYSEADSSQIYGWV